MLLLSSPSQAEPKVAQAAICDFASNQVIAIAVEEMRRPLRLMFIDQNGKVLYTTDFPVGDGNRGFSYLNTFLRFRQIAPPGLPRPVVLAASVSPGCSDVTYEIKLVAERAGRITTINPAPINLSRQDGIYLGYINAKYGHGMIIWQNEWEEEGHYAPHRYTITVYGWSNRANRFILFDRLTTKTKFKDSASALLHYRLPTRNYRDEIVIPSEVSTLGIEAELLGTDHRTTGVTSRPNHRGHISRCDLQGDATTSNP
jgi:hypothetical protein